MSKYTTGEMAKLCGITVRTVQYYDSRNILVPSELSEGGRRLYSEEDLHRLKIICFLREAGLPIESIKQLLKEEHPEKVISIMIGEQKTLLNAELIERQERLNLLEGLQNELKHIEHFTVDSIRDIAYMMENRAKLWEMRIKVLIVGFIMDAIEVSTLMLWILKGIWLPFVISMLVVVVPLGIWIGIYYISNTMYICPQCHMVFRPKLKENLWARHTPRTRKLTCPECKHHGFCVETYGKGDNTNA